MLTYGKFREEPIGLRSLLMRLADYDEIVNL